MVNGVDKYITAYAKIYFPDGHVCCDLCPLMETYARKQCRGTGNYLLDTRVTVDWKCPLKFDKEELDGQPETL